MQRNLFGGPDRPTFFNTTNLKPPVLGEREKRAHGQNEQILKFFENHRDQDFTPCEVHKRFTQWPLTSIRRVITSLTTQDFLIKTDVKRIGVYGDLVHCWKLNQTIKSN